MCTQVDLPRRQVKKLFLVEENRKIAVATPDSDAFALCTKLRLVVVEAAEERKADKRLGKTGKSSR